MKNKFNETGIDFGELPDMAKNEVAAFSTCQHTAQQPVLSINWADPEASKALILELMSIVNTAEEYEMLQSELAEIERLYISIPLKGGALHTMKQKIVKIKGVPVIDIYESLDGSYWFITEKLYKQDSVVEGKIYRNDQILFGYARLSACPEYAEFGNISETELKLVAAWKVPKRNWTVCPEVEEVEVAEQSGTGEEIGSSHPTDVSSGNCKAVMG